MTPEQLDMIKRLQPKIREAMGPWQEGDMFAMHGSNVHYVCKKDILELELYKTLRIPKPIDWQNPERGLWGMIDWDMWILRTGMGNANAYIRSADCDIKADPFTALLKALCEQEGV